MLLLLASTQIVVLSMQDTLSMGHGCFRDSSLDKSAKVMDHQASLLGRLGEPEPRSHYAPALWPAAPKATRPAPVPVSHCVLKAIPFIECEPACTVT